MEQLNQTDNYLNKMNSYIKKTIIVLLRLVSQGILWRHKPTVVAITGSVGKTTTKDVVAHGLSSVENVGKANKSFNSDFGTPLAIIGMDNPWGSVLGWIKVILKGIQIIIKSEYPKILVLEVGTRFPGDIPRIAKWIKPHVSLVTHIPNVPVHIEFFGTRENIIDEKSMLVKYTRKEGTVILNRDTDIFDIMSNTTNTVFSVGFSTEANIYAHSVNRIILNNEQYGMQFMVHVNDQDIPVVVPGFVAMHQIYGVLYAMAVAEVLNYDVVKVANSMANLPATPGRLNPLVGVDGTLILDDSYNASPAAMEAAIETLSLIDIPGRKIAILGDMLDLGKMTMDAHSKIGLSLKDATDYAFLIGPRMQYAYESAMNEKYPKTKIFYFERPLDALPQLQKIMKTGDAILVKGSQGMRMEQLVAELIEDKENIKNLLVRQDPEWLKRL